MPHLTKSNTQKAFTLIELLVSISIISMLTSIVLVSTGSVRAQSRDSSRIQQVRQIDLALRLYADTLGRVPDLSGCGVSASNPSESQAQSCVAISTPGEDGYDQWDDFIDQIEPYMKQVPGDPCPTCISPSGFPMGYTYIAPLAMQYYCNDLGTCSAGSGSYQVYAPLENYPYISGYKEVDDPFVPVSLQNKNLSLTLTANDVSGDVTILQNGISNTISGTGPLIVSDGTAVTVSWNVKHGNYCTHTSGTVPAELQGNSAWTPNPGLNSSFTFVPSTNMTLEINCFRNLAPQARADGIIDIVVQ